MSALCRSLSSCEKTSSLLGDVQRHRALARSSSGGLKSLFRRMRQGTVRLVRRNMLRSMRLNAMCCAHVRSNTTSRAGDAPFSQLRKSIGGGVSRKRS
eukprot:2222874-Pleurochrysis_carterae.AAC.1